MNIGKFFVKPKVIFAIIIALVIILTIEAVVITVIIRRQLEIMNPQETGTPTQGTTLGTEPTVPTEPTEPTIPTSCFLMLPESQTKSIPNSANHCLNFQ